MSCYSLFPLLFESQEYPIKVLLLLLHSVLMWLGFSALSHKEESVETKVPAKKRESYPSAAINRLFRISPMAKVYLLGLLMVELYGQFLHPYLLGSKLPFVPLLMISTYCAVGITYSWIWQLRRIVSSP